jgi:hypothetical protein
VSSISRTLQYIGCGTNTESATATATAAPPTARLTSPQPAAAPLTSTHTRLRAAVNGRRAARSGAHKLHVCTGRARVGGAAALRGGPGPGVRCTRGLRGLWGSGARLAAAPPSDGVVSGRSHWRQARPALVMMLIRHRKNYKGRRGTLYGPCKEIAIVGSRPSQGFTWLHRYTAVYIFVTTPQGFTWRYRYKCRRYTTSVSLQVPAPHQPAPLSLSLRTHRRRLCHVHQPRVHLQHPPKTRRHGCGDGCGDLRRIIGCGCGPTRYGKESRFQ